MPGGSRTVGASTPLSETSSVQGGNCDEPQRELIAMQLTGKIAARDTEVGVRRPQRNPDLEDGRRATPATSCRRLC
jgi:hypothetical protein